MKTQKGNFIWHEDQVVFVADNNGKWEIVIPEVKPHEKIELYNCGIDPYNPDEKAK